jgi:hypothetical protein
MDLYNANSLKQQSVGRHVAALWHIILFPRQPDFPLSPNAAYRGEAFINNSIVFGITRLEMEHMISG